MEVLKKTEPAGKRKSSSSCSVENHQNLGNTAGKYMKNEQLKFFCFQVIMRALIDERLDILREVKEHESIKY